MEDHDGPIVMPSPLNKIMRIVINAGGGGIGWESNSNFSEENYGAKKR